MLRKLMSLGLVGIMSASLMVGCSSNDKDDDTVTIKYVDENGNVVKKEKVTKEEAKQIENNTTDKTTQHKQHKQVINNNDKTTENHVKQPEKSNDTTKDNRNLDDQLYGNAARGTCPDCGRTAMVFNNGAGLKCAYCGFYDDGYFLPEEEPDPNYTDNKDDDTADDTSNDYNYDESQDDYNDEESIDNDNDVEESPSEPVEQDLN